MMFKPSSMKITQLVQKLLGVTVHRHMDITIPKYFSKMHFYRKSLQNEFACNNNVVYMKI